MQVFEAYLKFCLLSWWPCHVPTFLNNSVSLFYFKFLLSFGHWSCDVGKWLSNICLVSMLYTQESLMLFVSTSWSMLFKKDVCYDYIVHVSWSTRHLAFESVSPSVHFYHGCGHFTSGQLEIVLFIFLFMVQIHSLSLSDHFMRCRCLLRVHVCMYLYL